MKQAFEYIAVCVASCVSMPGVWGIFTGTCFKLCRFAVNQSFCEPLLACMVMMVECARLSGHRLVTSPGTHVMTIITHAILYFRKEVITQPLS